MRAIIASAMASASLLIATSCTRKSAAPLSLRMALVAAVPAPRSAGSRPVAAPMKRLREVPAISGKPSRVQFLEAHHQVEILLGASPWQSRSQGRARSARRTRRPPWRSPASGEEEELVVDHVGPFVAPAPGMHDDQPCPAVGRNLGDAGLALQAPDVVDDMRAGVDGEPRRFRTIGVDRDQRCLLWPALRSPAAPAPCSSAAETGTAAGLVDSPPTSMIAAPSAEHAARLRQRLLDARKWPPSEKLSGVTLRMPTISRLGAELDVAAMREAPAPRFERQHSMVGACAACVAKMQRRFTSLNAALALRLRALARSAQIAADAP